MIAFMDNTNVGREDENSYFCALGGISAIVYNAGVGLKLSRCKFGVFHIELLGHAIGPEGVPPSIGPLAVLRQLVKPAGGEEFMKFFVLAKYFSRLLTILQ